MEESKAAEYYDDLLRRGGNAAKYKQGLGFDNRTSNPFKPDSGPAGPVVFRKENAVESVREKLRKRGRDFSSEEHHSQSADVGQKNRLGQKTSSRSTSDEYDPRRRRARNSSRSLRRGGQFTRHSSDSETSERSHFSGGKSRSVNSRSPPVHDDRRSRRGSGHSSRKLTYRHERRSPSVSSDESHGRGRRRRRNGRSSSVSTDDNNGGRANPRRSGRDWSRSVSRERYSDRKATNRRSRTRYSYDKPHGRSRSRSPAFERLNSSRTGRHINTPKHHRNKYVKESSRKHLDEEKERAFHSNKQRNAEERGFNKVSAEEVKKKMLQGLSKAVARDRAKGMSDEWERFDLNKDVPLDDDADLDDPGGAMVAADDMNSLTRTGFTFPSSINQSTERRRRATHEAAIFGPPGGLIVRAPNSEKGLTEEKDGINRGSTHRGSSVIDQATDESTILSGTVVSEQVMQQQGTWQERARKLREAREAALAS